MPNGIVSNDRDALIKLAWYIESQMPDAEYADDGGGGTHETRDEYRLIYKHSSIVQGPDEASRALVLDSDATDTWADLKPVLIAKSDTDRTPLERTIATLPDAADFTTFVWPDDV